MTLQEFLTFIVSSGGNAIIASWILERIPWYQGLAAQMKQWVYFAGVLGLAVIGYVVLTYVPKETLDSLAPIFALIYASFGSVFVGSAFHKVDKLKQ